MLMFRLSEFSVAAIITELSEEDEDNTHQRTRLGALDSVWWQSPAIAVSHPCHQLSRY